MAETGSAPPEWVALILGLIYLVVFALIGSAEFPKPCPRPPRIIIYRVLPNRIDVITLMHYRQLLPSDFEKLD